MEAEAVVEMELKEEAEGDAEASYSGSGEGLPPWQNLVLIVAAGACLLYTSPSPRDH